MATLNLYKIDDTKKDRFMKKIEGIYDNLGSRNVFIKNDKTPTKFKMTLYIKHDEEDKDIAWNWALRCFDKDKYTTSSTPKGIIKIINNDELYVISFSYAYYNVDSFCNRDFPFEFAKRLEYEAVKTTALTNPNSKRNKTVNTYLNYNNLDFDSGESLTKVKAKIKVGKNFELFSENIEIGNSIKFSVSDPSLEKIAKIILYVEKFISETEVKVKIPLFIKTKNEEDILELDKTLLREIDLNHITIDISEYQIIATNIIFQNDAEYEISYNENVKKCNSLNDGTIREFIEENQLNLTDVLLDLSITVIKENGRFPTTVKKIMFYTNEAEKAVLLDGEWYRYNEDYLQYLRDSISEISITYNEIDNFYINKHEHFLNEKYHELKDMPDYKVLSEDKKKKKIKEKYYKEFYFNENLTKSGYQNFDRELERLGSHKLEVMDLYKDNIIYTVKIGNSSSKLCYAVDQSLVAIKIYHKKMLPGDFPTIKEVCLWLILDRGELPLIDGKPDINSLDMLILKNKLDTWKKEVRLLGYTPKININYVKDI